MNLNLKSLEILVTHNILECNCRAFLLFIICVCVNWHVQVNGHTSAVSGLN